MGEVSQLRRSDILVETAPENLPPVPEERYQIFATIPVGSFGKYVRLRSPPVYLSTPIFLPDSSLSAFQRRLLTSDFRPLPVVPWSGGPVVPCLI